MWIFAPHYRFHKPTWSDKFSKLGKSGFTKAGKQARQNPYANMISLDSHNTLGSLSKECLLHAVTLSWSLKFANIILGRPKFRKKMTLELFDLKINFQELTLNRCFSAQIWVVLGKMPKIWKNAKHFSSAAEFDIPGSNNWHNSTAAARSSKMQLFRKFSAANIQEWLHYHISIHNFFSHRKKPETNLFVRFVDQSKRELKIYFFIKI